VVPGDTSSGRTVEDLPGVADPWANAEVVAKSAAIAGSRSEDLCMAISSCVEINANPERRLRIDYPIEQMDLASMRENGVRSLDVCCWQCRHQVIINAVHWPRE
jgi:hypothetical protein